MSQASPVVAVSQASPVVAVGPAGVPAIAGTGLVRSFGTVHAVRGLDLHIAAGELYGLVGPDGAGKTTTIRLLTGLVDADAGEVRIGGRALTEKGVRETIGYMPQQYSLYGDLSIDENIRFFGRLFGLSRKDLAESRARLLSLTRLERFGDRRADALSGGMYKKLALACALLHRPRVLVLDEPTNGVDPVSRRELWDLLHEFVGEGMAVLLATPYMDEASRCNRVGLLNEGRLLAEGDPRTLTRTFRHPTLLVTARTADARATIEERLHTSSDVLALSPHGGALRVVVRQGTEAGFRALLDETGLVTGVETVSPDFEDVFLGLLADSAATRLAEGAAP